jgi:hypothetical protein
LIPEILAASVVSAIGAASPLGRHLLLVVLKKAGESQDDGDQKQKAALAAPLLKSSQ